MAVQVEAYEVIGDPPLNMGAAKLIDAVVSPGVAINPVGASGTVRGVTLIAIDAPLSPATLVATTEQLYATPLASEETSTGEAIVVPVRVIWPIALQVAV